MFDGFYIRRLMLKKQEAISKQRNRDLEYIVGIDPAEDIGIGGNCDDPQCTTGSGRYCSIAGVDGNNPICQGVSHCFCCYNDIKSIARNIDQNNQSFFNDDKLYYFRDNILETVLKLK